MKTNASMLPILLSSLVTLSSQQAHAVVLELGNHDYTLEQGKTFTQHIELPVTTTFSVNNTAGNITIIPSESDSVVIEATPTGFTTRAAGKLEVLLPENGKLKVKVVYPRNVFSGISGGGSVSIGDISIGGNSFSGARFGGSGMNTVTIGAQTIRSSDPISIVNGQVFSSGGSISVGSNHVIVGGFQSPQVDLKISIPSTQFAHLAVESASADVSVRNFGPGTDLTNDREIQVKSSGGSVELTNLSSKGGLNVSSKAGDLTLNSIICESSNFSAKSISGDVSLEKATASNFTFSSTSGDLKILDTIGEAVSVNTKSGDIKVFNHVGGSIQANSTSGDISLNNPSAQSEQGTSLSGRVRTSQQRRQSSSSRSSSSNRGNGRFDF